jgi:hypothetical protein
MLHSSRSSRSSAVRGSTWELDGGVAGVAFQVGEEPLSYFVLYGERFSQGLLGVAGAWVPHIVEMGSVAVGVSIADY